MKLLAFQDMNRSGSSIFFGCLSLLQSSVKFTGGGGGGGEESIFPADFECGMGRRGSEGVMASFLEVGSFGTVVKKRFMTLVSISLWNRGLKFEH